MSCGMPILGLTTTDRPSISSAPTLEPGVTKYLSSAPGTGSMVAEPRLRRNASRCGAVNLTSLLVSYSQRSKRRMSLRVPEVFAFNAIRTGFAVDFV